MRSPILSRSGYVLDSQELKILQPDGWLTLPLSEIAEVKKPSFAKAIVRLADGRRKTLDLSQLGTKGFSEVVDALKKAAHDHRALAAHVAKAEP
jgi:hypothetical protein